MSYSRYAIYYVPPMGDLSEFGARWLGWDIVRGEPVPQPDLPGLHDVTMTPRKYGFHGTLKPPFRLQKGTTAQQLETATARLAASLAPATCAGLELAKLGRFLALTPSGDTSALKQVAMSCVRELDCFRAPPNEAELQRRRKAALSPQQEHYLVQWGYPYVMEEFRFHMTLSGNLPAEETDAWVGTAQRQLPALPRPFVVDQIALCGERSDGCFELLHRYTLAG